jgi:alkylation response protein AidB-like acyl-CoA dehydrogenase
MEVELNNSSSIRNRGAYEIALKYSHERKALKEIFNHQAIASN